MTIAILSPMDLGRFGRGIRALRRRRGWRQQNLAEAARVSRTQVGRIERGESASISIVAMDRVASAAGGVAELLLRWQGEGLDRLLDEAHARLVDLLVQLLRALGWEVAVEVSFSRYGERGSIDVLAWHPARRALAVFEVKSVTPDMQAMLGGIDRKARLGPEIARQRGWDPLVVGRILVLGDDRTNRRRMERYASLVGAALPAGTRDVRRWLTDPVSPGVAGVLYLTDDHRAAANGPSRQRVRVRGKAPSTIGGDRAGE